MPRRAGQVDIKSWLEALKAGRSVATNGPLLTLTVDGRDIGDVVKLDKPQTRAHRGHRVAAGINFERLQLVQNGKVVQTQLRRRKTAATRLDWCARCASMSRAGSPSASRLRRKTN